MGLHAYHFAHGKGDDFGRPARRRSGRIVGPVCMRPGPTPRVVSLAKTPPKYVLRLLDVSPRSRRAAIPEQPKWTAPPELEGELRASIEEARDPSKLQEVTPEELERWARTGEWPESSG